MFGPFGWFRQRRLNRDLLKAVSEGATEEARRLLDAGASANARISCETALSIAGRSHRGNVATVRLLLERGALVNGDPKRGTVNPLLRASHQSDDEIIRLLITHGADVNALHPGLTPGLTVLQELVKWADLETLALLLERGADINKRSAVYEKRMSGGGLTALHSAAAIGRSRAVVFLLANGADVTLLDARGQSALDYARRALDQPYFWHGEHQEIAQQHRDTIALLEKETPHA